MRRTDLFRAQLAIVSALCFTASSIDAAELKDGSARDANAHVMYLDPEAATYEPVSRANLVYSGACVIALPPIAVINRISEIFLSSDFGPFDDARVRIKIEDENGSLFIDAAGGMFSESSGTSKQMSKSQFSELKALFNPLNRESGCRSLGRWPYLSHPG